MLFLMLLDCRGVMEGDQSCYTVNKSEKSADYKQVQISTLTHTRTHTHGLPHYIPTTSVSPSVVLGHGLSLLIYCSVC